MDYYNTYHNLIASRNKLNRKSNKDGMLERHHILPRCLGGSNDKNNLVYLTPREHFVAHLLLTKMYTGKEKAKMVFAFARMCQKNPNQKREINSRHFEMAKILMSKFCSGNNGSFFGKTHSDKDKKKFSEQKSGENNPMFGKDPWNKGKKLPPISDYQKSIISKTHSGKIISDETKMKMSISATGKTKSESHRKKLSEANTGKITSAETRQKIGNAHRGKEQKPLTCPNCGKDGKGSAMIRWHFDKCRLR